MSMRARRIATYAAVVAVFSVTFQMGVLQNPGFDIREFCMSMTSELAGLVFAITLLEIYINQRKGRNPGAYKKLMRRELELFAAALGKASALLEQDTPDGEALALVGADLRWRGERLVDRYAEEMEEDTLFRIHYLLMEGETLGRLEAAGQAVDPPASDGRERQAIDKLMEQYGQAAE